MRTKEIYVPTAADEWDLYRRQPGADDAGAELGRILRAKLEDASPLLDSDDVGRLEAAIRIRDEMYEEMNRFSSLGARDTEPEVTLVRCIGGYLDVELSRW